MHPHLLDLDKPLYQVVDDLLSPDECRALIARIDALGPEVAPVSLPGGPRVDLGTRNNTRVMFEDPPLAAELFARVRPHVPGEIKGMGVAGANERLRCYRYDVGQRFRPHYDGAFVRSPDERSQLTFMVYLNDAFEGGETALIDVGVRITPRAGRALLFQHHQLHEGCEVSRGVKYVVRSDIMYRRPAETTSPGGPPRARPAVT